MPKGYLCADWLSNTRTPVGIARYHLHWLAGEDGPGKGLIAGGGAGESQNLLLLWEEAARTAKGGSIGKAGVSLLSLRV